MSKNHVKFPKIYHLTFLDIVVKAILVVVVFLFIVAWIKVDLVCGRRGVYNLFGS